MDEILGFFDFIFPIVDTSSIRLLKKFRVALCLVLYMVSMATAIANDVVLSGVVIRVMDGDTVELQTPQMQSVHIRLAGIDAPEKNQDFGQRAKQELTRLCFRQPTQADVRALDRYGRTVARVRCNGVDAASKLLSGGLAWHFSRYAATQPKKEADDDREAQEMAKMSHQGLWSMPNPKAPWDWRAMQKSSSPP